MSDREPLHIHRDYDFGGPVDWDALAERIGPEVLRRRVARQNLHYTSAVVRAKRFLSRQLVKIAAEWAFRLSGLYGLGHRNFRDLHIVQHRFEVPGWPADLEGLRVLQLSDLHLDLDPGLVPVVVDLLSDESLQYDLAVVTGDFRDSTYGDFTESLRLTREVVEALRPPVFGVLGNHDYIDMAPVLEDMGMTMLLNESVRVQLNGRASGVWLTGIDDPHLYRTGMVARAASAIPEDERGAAIFLSHAPEAFAEAGAAGFKVFLCGHTHGGQICLPGGHPLLTHCRAPRFCARGGWRYGEMHGYTTTGTGGCGAALRLNCPPEIVLHTFFRSTDLNPDGT